MAMCRGEMCRAVWGLGLVVAALAGAGPALDNEGEFDEISIPETAPGLEVNVIDPVPPENCTIKSKAGDTMAVHFIGWIHNKSKAGEPGKKFDDSGQREPFIFVLGRGKAIRGWDIGLQNMCIGEIRELTVPPELAYGDKQEGPDIKPGSMLLFHIELINVGRKIERNVFLEIDLMGDGDHMLSEAELKHWYHEKHGLDLPSALMENEDKDKDGFISWKEFRGPKGRDPIIPGQEIPTEPKLHTGLHADDEDAEGQIGDTDESNPAAADAQAKDEL